MKLNEIKSKNWSLSLTTYGKTVEGVDDISQCIIIIVTTRKNTDPLRRDFGSDIYEYQDKPYNEGIPRMIKAAVDALEIWETRITVTKVGYKFDASGAVEFTIEWKEKTTGTPGATKVLINGTN